MDPNHQRGRSLSAGRIQQNHTPSPHQAYHDALSANMGLDPSVANSTFTTGKFNAQDMNMPNQVNFSMNTFQQSNDQSEYMPQTSLPENTFYDQGQMQNMYQQDQTLSSGFNAGTTLDSFIDPTGGQGGDYNLNEYPNEGSFGQDYSQQTQFPNQQSSQGINATNLSQLSSPPIHTPPNLLSPEDQPSPGQSTSPGSTSNQYYTPQHSRHASLDPASAAFPQTQEWQVPLGNSAFQHRRLPSDQSDMSSSAAPSPYLGHSDNFDSFESEHSPLLNPQPDVHDYLTNTFGIENASLTEQTGRSPHQHPQLPPNAYGMENMSLTDQRQRSRSHSNHASPRMMPQQPQGLGLNQDFSLSQQIAGQMSGPGPEIFTSHADAGMSSLEKMHQINGSSVSDMGQASQFPIPGIEIEPAPVSRQASFEPDNGDSNFDALSPPTSKSRGRSKSDPHVRPGSRPISRSVSPGAGHVRSPSLAGPTSPGSQSVRSLSPMAPLSSSRDPSPNRADKNRRSSTSSLPSRDYILDLADPARPNASPNSNTGRVQKHPANFQCHLCPKKFTRAYNLRSHLRTHTDERPFVCTVCGKAFARQHDRKRHEGLHSGEKKFVCKGELGSGGSWGCGRRFARADALGRHFRSEAGRVCIKPLLDEEAAERDRQRMLEQRQMQMQAGVLQPVQQPLIIPSSGPSVNGGGQFMLPAALLQQYPALNNIDWSTLAQGDDPGELSDMGGGGRSSFDASSGGEGVWGDDDGIGDVGDGGGYGSGNGLMYAQQGGQNWQ